MTKQPETITITLDVPATLPVKAGGHETSVPVADLHDDALAYVFEYGLRRAVQDAVNSALHAARKAGAKVDERDAAREFDKRIADLMTGDVRRRAAGVPGLTEAESVLAEIVKGLRTVHAPFGEAWDATKGKPSPVRAIAMLDRLASAPDAVRNMVRESAITFAGLDPAKADAAFEAIAARHA